MAFHQKIIIILLGLGFAACSSMQTHTLATPTPFQAPEKPSLEAWTGVPSATAVRKASTPEPSKSPPPTSIANSIVDFDPPPTNPEPGAVWESPVDQMPLVFVPAGKFLMGTDKNFAFPEDDEMPQRRVEMNGFWIDQFEVSNQRYARCVEQGACTPPTAFGGKDREDYYQNRDYQEFPVIHVSWEQANQYCRWVGRRLPTEAEWEKAARGTTGQVYPWGWVGSSIGSQGVRANYCDANCSYEYRDEQVDDGFDETAPSESFQAGASPYGALHMAGNVWEWVADWYEADYYQNAPGENPTGPRTGTLKVIRGGSWMDQAWLGTIFGLRAANRAAHEPQSGEFYLGFRCAISGSSSEP
jgi:formylglycine-generating enzyme required for sulfatase activity